MHIFTGLDHQAFLIGRAVLGLVWVLVRLRLALPRPIVVDVAASMLIGLGLYWFVSRSFIAS
jgi:hypothetical protein